MALPLVEALEAGAHVLEEGSAALENELDDGTETIYRMITFYITAIYSEYFFSIPYQRGRSDLTLQACLKFTVKEAEQSFRHSCSFYC